MGVRWPRGVAARVVGWSGLGIVWAACGGSDFQSAQGAGAGGGATVGGSAGVAGSDAASGGGAGSGGAGPGGTGAAGADGGVSEGGAGQGGEDAGVTEGGGTDVEDCLTSGCEAGSYCAAEEKRCRSCRDMSRFRFGEATRVAGPSDDALGNERFPRVTPGGESMVYRAGANPPSLRISRTLGALGAPILGAGSEAPESGPTPTAPFEVLSPLTNFFHDRAVTGQRRELVAGNLAGGTVVGRLALPAPFNAEGGSSDYSVAVSAGRGRLWWMTTRSGGATLVTSRYPAASGEPTGVALRVDVDGTNHCPWLGVDATPWVPEEGDLLLFRSVPTSRTCQLLGTAGDRSDLYWVALDSQGQAIGVAARLAPPSVLLADDTDPSLSPDRCTLYFSTDRGGSYEIYAARRE